MKTQHEDAKATVVDYRREVDGSANPNYGKDVTVSYAFDYDQCENDTELQRKFSPDALLNLGNQRLKATANSSARQKAVSDYARSGDDAAREELVTSIIKMAKLKGKEMSRADAETYADSLS